MKSSRFEYPVEVDDPRRFFLAVTQFTQWLNTSFPKIASDFPVSYQQARVLYLVRYFNAGMSEIARQLQVAPTVITGMVDRLESRGFIERQPDRQDRRRIKLVLTDKGERASVMIEQRYIELLEESIRKMSKEDQETFSKGLALLSGVLADLEKTTASLESSGKQESDY